MEVLGGTNKRAVAPELRYPGCGEENTADAKRAKTEQFDGLYWLVQASELEAAQIAKPRPVPHILPVNPLPIPSKPCITKGAVSDPQPSQVDASKPKIQQQTSTSQASRVRQEIRDGILKVKENMERLTAEDARNKVSFQYPPVAQIKQAKPQDINQRRAPLGIRLPFTSLPVPSYHRVYIRRD